MPEVDGCVCGDGWVANAPLSLGFSWPMLPGGGRNARCHQAGFDILTGTAVHGYATTAISSNRHSPIPRISHIANRPKKGLTFQSTGSPILSAGKGVTAMEVKQKISLCPECSACPEVEILHQDGKPMAVRIGEGAERITLPTAAWNTLIRYAREGVLTTL